MAITVKKIELWNVVVDNQPGSLAKVLEPLAEAGADLEIVMGTAIPGEEGKASVGVFPVKGKKVVTAAREAGLAPAATMPSLIVGGENSAGLGRRMSEALADAGINIGVVVAQVVGENFSALFGFDNQDDATKAVALLKKVGSAASRAAAKSASRTTAKAPAKGASKRTPAKASSARKPAKTSAKPMATKGSRKTAPSRRSR